MISANVIQLRHMLSEKFPEARMGLAAPVAVAETSAWPTGLPLIDQPLRGGLPKGTLTEIIGASSGSATLIRQLLVSGQTQITAFIDGNDSLDVTPMDESILSRMLWVRCRNTDAALKAADLILRDGNLSLVLIDLKLNSEKELRKIPATVWYRFQRLIEDTATVCLVVTPCPVVSPAQTRITVASRLSIKSLEWNPGQLWAGLDLEISDRLQLYEKRRVSVA